MPGKRDDPAAAAAATTQIDAYLAMLPEDQRAALKSLRGAIAAVAPEAVEAISYGVPAFRYHGGGRSSRTRQRRRTARSSR